MDEIESLHRRKSKTILVRVSESMKEQCQVAADEEEIKLTTWARETLYKRLKEKKEGGNNKIV